MKNRKIRIGFYGLVTMLVFASCYDTDIPGMEGAAGSTSTDTKVYNGKPDTINYRRVITEQELDDAIKMTRKVVFQLPAAQHALRGGKEGGAPVPHQYQFQYSLYTDNFAGYFCATQDFGGQLRSSYAYNPSFNSGPNGSYINVKNAVVPIMNYPGIDSIPEIKATALLLYDYAAIDAADIYGPIPYQEYKVNKQSYPYTYNSVEEIYKTTVSNIDTIVACYKHFASRPDWYKKKLNNILNQNDYLSVSVTFDDWMRFANSLKLRMAIHIAKIDPILAKKWAEEAVESGVIETLEQQMGIRNEVSGCISPLITISGTWNDTRLNASFESIMMSYKHPFLGNTFEKNTIDIAEKSFTDRYGKPLPITREPLKANTRIVGLRSGVRMLPGQ
ncbi:MAG: SusD/RagB family nutrient-binding outer membrane lipoprotein, partial [Bacteroidaceae bacterium]